MTTNPLGEQAPIPADLVLVGSSALRWHILAWPGSRTPSGVESDWISTFDRMQDSIAQIAATSAYPLDGKKWVLRTPSRIYEFEIAWPGSLGEEFTALAQIDGSMIETEFGHTLLPSLNLLYALKMSHRYLRNSPHFIKTMRDIQLMRRYGAVIRSEHKDWFNRREVETYSYGHPKLNQSKANFFSGDGIDYQYDHDSLHEAVKLGDRPAYTYYQVPGEEVKSSRTMFEQLPRQGQINAGLEETYVLALERSQIPFPGTDPKKSFEIALMKVCTSITSGWFRAFCWESYDEILSQYDSNYVARFQTALDSGRIHPYRMA